MGGTLREGGGAGAGAGAGAGGAGGVAPVGAGGFPKGGMLGVLLNIDKNIAKLLECCRAGCGGGGAGAGAPNALARADIVKEKQDRLLAAEQQRSAEKLKQKEESKAKVAEKANKEFNQELLGKFKKVKMIFNCSYIILILFKVYTFVIEY